MSAASDLDQSTMCQWYEDINDSKLWHTSCGRIWEFIEAGPNENGVKVCHNCGKPVDVMPLQGDEND